MFKFSPRSTNLLLVIPKVSNGLAKCNYVFKASSIWNSLIHKLLNQCIPNSSGIMIPGSAYGSDLTTSISVMKHKLKDVLLGVQKHDSRVRQGWKKSDEWLSENFYSI